MAGDGLEIVELIALNEEAKKIQTLLNEYKPIEFRQIQLPNDEMLIRILLDTEQSEAVLDILEKNQIGKK